MAAKPAPLALRAVLSRIQSSTLRWLDLPRRKQRTKWWRALRIRCKSGRSLPLGPGMSDTASVQFGTASVQAKGANAIVEAANLEFTAAPARPRRSAMRGRGCRVPRIWRGDASASLASSPRGHRSRRTKVPYPPDFAVPASRVFGSVRPKAVARDFGSGWSSRPEAVIRTLVMLVGRLTSTRRAAPLPGSDRRYRSLR